MSYIFQQLETNKRLFYKLLHGVPEAIHRWKPDEKKWCMLEVICHLYDEEREDFRKRIQCIWEAPALAPPPFDPVRYVKERDYMGQNFEKMLQRFMEERQHSLDWLESLNHPDWSAAFEYAPLKGRTARFYITNWLAHDYLHIRQIIRLKYDYLAYAAEADLAYAGNWK